MYLVHKKVVQEVKAHGRLVVLGLLLRAVGLGEVADEQPDVLHGLVVADVIAHVARRDGCLLVRGDLDDAKLREVKLDDWRERRLDLLHNRVTPSVLVVVGRRTVEIVEGLAHAAHHLVDDVGRLIGASHVVGHGQVGLLVRQELIDVVVDLVVRDTLLVDVDQVVPDVRVATVLVFLLEDFVAADLVGVTALGADDEPVGVLVVVDASNQLLARVGVGVLDWNVRQLVGVIDGRPFALFVAREDVEELGVLLTELLGVVHHVVVLVVHEEEAIRLVWREVLDERLAAALEVLRDGLIEHITVRLRWVKVARIVDVWNRRGAEEPHTFVFVRVDHCALIGLLDEVGILGLEEVLVDRHALRNLVGERDDDVLTEGLLDIDNHAACLLVEILEVLDIGALVGVVEEDERVGLENLLHLEHRVVLLGLEKVLEAVGEGARVVLLVDGLHVNEHLGDVGEVGGVHVFLIEQLQLSTIKHDFSFF